MKTQRTHHKILICEKLSLRLEKLHIATFLGRYREGMVYLCGHYHMLGGAVPNMYTLQQAGFLELELADWKDNRM